MKWNFLFIAFLFFCENTLVAQDSYGIDLVFNWSSTDTNITGYNDVWGFEYNGEEYGVIGSNWGTHFIQTSSSQPLEINSFEGEKNEVTWRDFKVYSHYVYGVSDGDTNSLQIFDIQYLPDSVVKIVDSDLYSQSSHNIFIDSNRIYFCSNQVNWNKSNQALDIFSLEDPINPIRLKSFSDDFFDGYALHDLFVRDHIAYCSAGNGGLHIYDFTDVENPILKAKLNVYPDQGYNHSSWLSEDGTKLVVADEVPSGLALKLFDVSDFDNMEFLDVFHSNDLATPHNPFFANDKIVVSYYLDGVQIFDYSNIFNVNRVGYYDTYPDDTSYFDWSPYGGCWGVYPFLPSKKILASDRTYGLFVLEADFSSLGSIDEKKINKVQLFCNPLKNDIIELNSEKKINQIWIFDNSGRFLINKKINNNKSNIDFYTQPYGKYLISIQLEDDTYETIKFIK